MLRSTPLLPVTLNDRTTCGMMKDGQRSLHFRSSECKEITDLRTLGWPIQTNGTFWNILKSRIISCNNDHRCKLLIPQSYVRDHSGSNCKLEPKFSIGTVKLMSLVDVRLFISLVVVCCYQ